MYKISNYNLYESYHTYGERKDRVDFIKNELGFGSVILEGPDWVHPENDYLLTSTGVIIFKPRTMNKIITLFIITESRAEKLFKQNAMTMSDEYREVIRKANYAKYIYGKRNNLTHL